MEASHFDERSFFSAVHASGVRALLIGRRALVLLGLPLLTADYDYWIAIDDIALRRPTLDDVFIALTGHAAEEPEAEEVAA